MSQNFIPCERDQRFLMPLDMREWLAEDHLALFLIDAVDRLDLTGLYGAYRSDGWGRAAFDPKMMVTLLLYAFAVGERSTRVIERRCIEDVAFRVITANHAPDHSTIARFIGRHGDAFKELFTQVLGLCVSAGMVKVGNVALDGTKVAANASRSKNATRDRISKLVDGIFEEAARLNDDDDRAHGDERGDELPDKLANRLSRLQFLDQELAERESADHDQQQHRAELADKRERGEPVRGRKPLPPEQRKNERGEKPKRINTTDPESRVMKVTGGYMQAFNGQALVSEDQVVIAAAVTHELDVSQLMPMIAQGHENLDRVGAPKMGTVLADAGYLSEDNLGADVGVDLLVAPAKAVKLDEITGSPVHDDRERRRQELEAEAARRAGIMERVTAGEVTMLEARELLGLSQAQTYSVRNRFARGGIEGLRKMLRVPQPRPSRCARMINRFRDEDVRAIYAKRSMIVEPVFGQVKTTQDGRRFLRRGRDRCDVEWSLLLTAHNIKKAWRHQARPGGPRHTNCCHAFLRGAILTTRPRRSTTGSSRALSP